MLRIISTDNIDRLASGELLDRGTCPQCHTTISSSSAAFPWRCRRCGQRWSARRLATVAAYATWVDARAERRDGAVSPDDTETRHPLVVAV